MGETDNLEWIWGEQSYVRQIEVNRCSSQAQRNRLCGVFDGGRLVVASSQMRRVWSHWMLRKFPKPTRLEAFSNEGARGDYQLRAW